MYQKTPVKGFLKESALWTLSNALGVGVPVAAVYIGLHVLMGSPMTRVSMAMAATALLTLTWGSWSSLVWAKNRMLRASMQMMTVIPGILLLLLAGLGFYIGRGSLLFWIALLANGAGTIAASFMLARTVGATAASDSPTGYLTGFGVFPLVATGAAGGVGYLWYLFVSNPLATDWRSLFSFSFFFVTTLAIVLISTVVPAVTTVICRQLAAPKQR
ncbi:hypothetical protein FIV42_21760 [Persicimonas caeni]|uniref:Uncharacterized protein n=1 Tax=Persicimonas caeni TaxID=2292766 RepID=A0A4Y6PY66_PERCE|nr:hypothetical protein [Persicimonas caeni]QDG53274.1 hypothetical protein FIV42_21760 [Persicimonas caeni]QED34496.1 hypothetical protein FRD00_21755 [Persicimonas caeni]